MKSIEEGLSPILGYLLAIKRDTVNGWYVLEIGVPCDWIYKGNNYINCEVTKKTEVGHLLTISPQKNNVLIDDLIEFVKLIIETNSKILEKEKEFIGKMDDVMKELKKQKDSFYKELDDLRDKSFNKFNNKNSGSGSLNEDGTVTHKKRRGRPSKKPQTTIELEEKNDSTEAKPTE